MIIKSKPQLINFKAFWLIVFIYFIGLSNMQVLAFTKIDSLKQLLKSKQKDTEDVMAKICWEYRYHYPDSARLYGAKAISLAQKNNNLPVLAIAYHNLAVVYEAQSNFDKSLELNLKSLAIKKRINDVIGIANSYNNLAGIHDQKGDFPKAVSYYKQAYEIYKKNNSKEDVAMINLNLGILFKAQKEYKKVLKYYLEAYEIYKELGKTFEMGASEANLGSVYFYLNNYQKCLYYSKLAEKKFIDLKVDKFLPVVRANIGLAYGKMGNFKLSVSFLKKAIQGHTAFNNKKELAFTFIHLARNYVPVNPDSSLAFAKNALKHATDCASIPEMMDARKLLSDIYELKGAHKLALENYISYSTLKDSLFKIEKQKELNQFNVLFETEKKERRITELNQQSAIQKLEIKQTNIYLYAAVIFIGFCVLSAFLLLNRQKIKNQVRLQQEINKQHEITTKEIFKAEERERRRIASDLHDGVGQLLSASLLNFNSLIAKTNLQDPQLILLSEKSIALLNESYEEMRSISHQMMPNALLKSGLASAIREFINKIDHQALKISLEIIGLNHKLEENIETVIYRVIQEATNNVIKHAKATALTIQILQDEEGLTVSIEDNGVGFDKEIQHLGFGLKNMQNRIYAMKGTIELDSRPHKGTLITFFLPV
ncbi:tetratricopeptide repeat-containing sensor histidine kinase [Pedobacter glucosidilyticus]|uniref:tetratricopeptide repeat-containing sensor histidine kinase n=1 Tax=Pedobacter glucosidilyticus TaxID=1122941 RepID=UPI0026EF4534|nr:sensor histidine kinase [Pedobacter glucosidilyticus]